MPRNDDIQFTDPIPLLRGIGTVRDAGGSEFELVVTGPEEDVLAFLETPTLRLEVRPPSPAEEQELDLDPSSSPTREPGYAEQRSGEQEGPTAEELSRSLLIEVTLRSSTVEPPFVLHFEDDPPIAQGSPPKTYGFTDPVRATVVCTSMAGNVNLYLHEWVNCKGGGYWTQRCASTKATPEDKCEVDKLYTGRWLVLVRAVSDSYYTLTGDLYVP